MYHHLATEGNTPPDPNPISPCCLIRQLVIPDDLVIAYSPEEREAGRRYEAAVIRLALTNPDCRIVRERRAAVTALLAAARRDGAAGVCR